MILVRKVIPTSNTPFSTYTCVGTRESDVLDRWVGVVVSWIEGRDVERSLIEGHHVALEVPARSWFYLFTTAQAA